MEPVVCIARPDATTQGRGENIVLGLIYGGAGRIAPANHDPALAVMRAIPITTSRETAQFALSKLILSCRRCFSTNSVCIAALDLRQS